MEPAQSSSNLCVQSGTLQGPTALFLGTSEISNSPTTAVCCVPCFVPFVHFLHGSFWAWSPDPQRRHHLPPPFSSLECFSCFLCVLQFSLQTLAWSRDPFPSFCAHIVTFQSLKMPNSREVLSLLFAILLSSWKSSYLVF